VTAVNPEMLVVERLRGGAATSAGTSLQGRTDRSNYACKSSPVRKYLQGEGGVVVRFNMHYSI
jgi:hypothetical protein